MFLRPARAPDYEPPDGLPQLQAGRVAGAPPQLGDETRLRHFPRSLSSGSRASGQPARKTLSGAPSHVSRTSRPQRWSARKGMTGETTRTAWTSANQSVRKAASS